MGDLKKIGIFAIVMTIIGFLMHVVESILTMRYYTDPSYFAVWSKVMMPVAGPPPTSYFILSILFSLVGWILFAFVYAKLGGVLKQKDFIKKGLKFGALIFLIAGLPFTLTMYLLINIPPMLLISWMISGLALYLVGGILAAKLIKPE